MTSGDGFVHLHVHSSFSMIDGGSSISELVQTAVGIGQPAIGLTDHGVVNGLFDFWKTCRQTGIQPVLGLEAYVTPETDRRDTSPISWDPTPRRRRNPDDVGGNGRVTHLSLWAETDEGLENMFSMSSAANLEGRVGRYPRMDRELLSRYAAGLICGSGCPSGAIQTRLRLGQFDDALRMAGDLQDIFGRGNFFVEIMDHGLEMERRVRSGLLEIARKLDAPMVATADVHYASPAARIAQEMRMCIEAGDSWNNPSRFRLYGERYHLLSGYEMRSLFADIPEACDNTLLIAERCRAGFHPQAEGSLMPTHNYCPEESAASALRRMVEAGADRLHGAMTDDIRKRMEQELYAIGLVHAEEYLLAVADMKQQLEESGYVFADSEGRARASLVCHALGITQTNPMELGMSAGRFINGRNPKFPVVTLRGKSGIAPLALKVMRERYGEGHVAPTVEYVKYGLAKAIRAVSGALGQQHGVSSGAEAIGDWMHDERLRDVEDRIAQFPQRRFVREGSIVLSARPLSEFTSLIQQVDGTVAVAFDSHTCTELGLPRVNILGSTALARSKNKRQFDTLF